MNTDVMFSSATDLWATPQAFFDKLNEEFNFTLDPCATADNAKCEVYFTKQDNGLTQDWGGTVYSATPLMAESCESGWRSVAESRKSPTQRL